MILTVIISILLSILSTSVMSYISMATPIGPWIAPTLVLIAMLLFKILRQHAAYSERLALVTAAGSVGGILGTACAFSIPTLYFLDPVFFNAWMANPYYFAAVVTGLAFAGGSFGLWVADVLEHKFIVQEKLSFPIGELTYKMIAAQHQVKKAFELMVGFVGTAVFCVLKDGLYGFNGIIPRTFTLVPKVSFGLLYIPSIRFDMWPMVWAIGFVTGHVIAIPLAVGAIANIVLIDPLNRAYFPHISSIEFILAFCSGMIITGTFLSFLGAPKMLWKSIKKMVAASKNGLGGAVGTTHNYAKYLIELVCILMFIISFLTYFGFSFIAQLYLLFFTFICTHEIANQAGKIGLARLGAFATFVMVPAMLLFNLSLVQIVFIAAFVEICGGVASDMLFGRKLAHLAAISSTKIRTYQWLGLVVSSLCIGGVFWALINHFTLGSPELFALKAQNRQLLINARSFDLYVLALGLIFGFVLKKTKINPSLVLGGILMPINISLGLIVGGLCSLFSKDRERWYPFWSGVFASNSLWMLIKAIL